MIMNKSCRSMSVQFLKLNTRICVSLAVSAHCDPSDKTGARVSRVNDIGVTSAYCLVRTTVVHQDKNKY